MTISVARHRPGILEGLCVMRMPAIIFVGSLSAFTAGCSVDILHYGAKNLVYAPCNRLNGAKECVKANGLAEESWRHFQDSNPSHNFSKDFADGYVFGFADFVEKGGPGNPPVVAPLKYRKVRYETPEGHQRIADWFAGCRAGIAAGMASGYREGVILPMSVSPPRPRAGYGTPEMFPTFEPESTLPAPRPTAPEPIPVPPRPVPAPGGAGPAHPGAVPAFPPPTEAPRLPSLDARPATEPGLPQAMEQPTDGNRVAETLGPQAALWPPATPGFRTTPPPPVRMTLTPPWEEPRPTARPISPGTDGAADAQRLADAFPPASTVADRRSLGDGSTVDTGVWMPARPVRRAEASLGTSAMEPRPIAVGQTAKPVPPRAATLRSESPPPPNPTDDPPITVSHRGARWQN